jgi:hypothetical protein
VSPALSLQVEIIQGLPDNAIISLYRCGPMVDLCHGPHLPNTGYIKAHAVHNVSRAFWRADVTKEPLMVRRPLVLLLLHDSHNLSDKLSCSRTLPASTKTQSSFTTRKSGL